MPKFQVTRTKHIEAPIDKVYKTLNDFHTWRSWSPWLITEPEATVDVQPDGKFYSWNGKRTGSGNMKIISEKENEKIDMDLLFLKPWKSKAKTNFVLKESNGGTDVTWHMDSSLPFFMFWMKKQMISFIGSDYDRGLALLKDLMEDGEVHSKLDFIGIQDYPGHQFIGIRTTCTSEEVGSKMSDDFSKLWAFMDDKKELMADIPFSIYHKWDMVKGMVEYTIGAPVRSIPDGLPARMISSEIPKTKIYTLRHTGPFAHLGNAWGTMYSMTRQKGLDFKFTKGIHPFETYVNDPSDTKPNDLITDINFAIKMK